MRNTGKGQEMKNKDWTRSSVKLTYKDKSIPIRCMVLAGLAVHKNLDSDDTWTVSHLASGMKLPFEFEKRTAVKGFVEKIKDIIDWTIPTPEQISRELHKGFPAISFINRINNIAVDFENLAW